MDSATKAETISPTPRAASPPPEDKAAAKAILEALEASPSYKVEHDLSAYLTSPLIDSPWEEDFLTTPALLPGGDMGIDVMASPALLDNDEAYTNAPLFGDEPLFEPLTFEKLNADRSGLALDSLSPRFSSELPASPTSSMSPASCTGGRGKKSAGKHDTKTRRKSVPTGTRKNVTPESLIPVDAPIQGRKYVAESATSRKELPAVFARKRKRASSELGNEEDILTAPPTNAELSAIEAKRRQNTLAARRSRKRKLEHQRELESILDNERAEKDAWKQRALAFEAILNSNGVRIPPEFAIQRVQAPGPHWILARCFPTVFRLSNDVTNSVRFVSSCRFSHYAPLPLPRPYILRSSILNKSFLYTILYLKTLFPPFLPQTS